MRIGIFGGSFNPPHLMHKNIALKLIENDYLDKVIYVPAGDKYPKDELIKAIYRYEMLKLMTQEYDNLLVSDYELKSTLTYNYQTLDYFQSLYPDDEIYFICGSDNIKVIPRWRKSEYLLENYHILVINRNNDKLDDVLNNMNSQNIILVNMEENNISSTYIRKSLKEKQKTRILKQLDKNVLEYIEKNKIYEVI